VLAKSYIQRWALWPKQFRARVTRSLGRPPRPRLVALINWSSAECLPFAAAATYRSARQCKSGTTRRKMGPGLEHPQRITQRRSQLVPCKVFKHVTAINSISAVIRDRQTAYDVPKPDGNKRPTVERKIPHIPGICSRRSLGDASKLSHPAGAQIPQPYWTYRRSSMPADIRLSGAWGKFK
jgi:hypothetical protein